MFKRYFDSSGFGYIALLAIAVGCMLLFAIAAPKPDKGTTDIAGSVGIAANVDALPAVTADTSIAQQLERLCSQPSVTCELSVVDHATTAQTADSAGFGGDRFSVEPVADERLNL